MKLLDRLSSAKLIGLALLCNNNTILPNLLINPISFTNKNNRLISVRSNYSTNLNPISNGKINTLFNKLEKMELINKTVLKFKALNDCYSSKRS